MVLDPVVVGVTGRRGVEDEVDVPINQRHRVQEPQTVHAQEHAPQRRHGAPIILALLLGRVCERAVQIPVD